MICKALLLDFDNTMVGTEKANFFLFKSTVEGLVGRELTPEDGVNFDGYTWKEIFQILNDKYLPEMAPDEIRRIFIDAKTKYFEQQQAPIAHGLHDLLTLDMKKAIVTGSSMEEVQMFAHAVDLSKFDLIASDEKYDKGKPEPDGYLYAAEMLGVKPSECIAVEDSRIGITSAKAAGIRTVFTKEFADDDHSAIADHTVETMAEVKKLLQV